MTIVKLILMALSALVFIYYFLYLRQLKIIKNEVKQAVGFKLFFLSFLMMAASAGFILLLLLSLGFQIILPKVF